jgi:tetratricopeptide (TPR) repeat protein
LSIREKVLGPEHPDRATSLNNLAKLYYRQEKIEVAEDFSRRATTIVEKSLGPCHPITAKVFENRAEILRALTRTDEAQVFLDRAKKSKPGECANPN